MAAVEDRLRPVHKYEVRLALLQEEEHMGFYFTTVGLELPDGRAGEMVIKNETMMLSVNNDVICTFPDRILTLEPGTGRGVMSMELETGMELVLLVVPAHPRLQAAAQTDQGRSSMAPARYGRPDLDYRPLAEAT
jgi:DUF917 family protein